MAYPLRQVRAGEDLAATGLAELLAAGRPPAPRAPRKRSRRERGEPVAPRLGWYGAYAGRAATEARPEEYRAATGQVAGLYPYLNNSSLPPIGAFIGYNVLTRRAFAAHPVAWVAESLVANPNMLITGIPGSGKSAHIKALILRLLAFGTRSLVAGDVKAEYTPLCRFLGVEPLELGPGLPGRLNPLDAGPLGRDLDKVTDQEEFQSRLREIHRRRLALLTALLELQMRRPLLPTESEAVSVALKEVTGELRASTQLAPPTLTAVHAVLRDPTEDMAWELRVRDRDLQRTREELRSVRAALGVMVTGHLGGLFDKESTSRLDWDAPIASVDISRMQGYGDDVVAMVMTCVSSWAQAAVDEPGPARIVVRDELWRLMRSGGASQVAKLDSDLRLSRFEKKLHILATHRLSDFEAVGPADSEAVRIARDLVSSCDTRVILAQDVRPLRAIKDAIGLTNAAAELIASWGRAHVGRGLWQVGRHGAHPIQLHLTALEQRLFHTDERMTA